MVKIIEKSLEERAEEVLFDRLCALTKEMIQAPFSVYDGSKPLSLGVYTPEKKAAIISVHPTLKQVHITNSEYFHLALTLAKRYERETGQEFTLKKD